MERRLRASGAYDGDVAEHDASSAAAPLQIAPPRPRPTIHNVSPLPGQSIDEALEEAELRYIEDFPEQFYDDSDDDDDGDESDDDGYDGGYDDDAPAAAARAANRVVGPGAMPLLRGRAGTLAYVENQRSLLLEGRGRFIFSFTAPSSPTHRTKKQNCAHTHSLIRPHLVDIVEDLSRIYAHYNHHIMMAARSGEWVPPMVHSLRHRDGRFCALVPDHIERRLAGGVSVYYVIALLEKSLNLALGYLLRSRLRNTLY